MYEGQIQAVKLEKAPAADLTVVDDINARLNYLLEQTGRGISNMEAFFVRAGAGGLDSKCAEPNAPEPNGFRKTEMALVSLQRNVHALADLIEKLKQIA